MSKAFVKNIEPQTDDELPAELTVPTGSKNYMTPAGYKRLKDELRQLVNIERPDIVKVVSWAASNGDRSENGDYLYGKKRLRDIDRRIRFLTKRLDQAEVVDPVFREATDQIFFGATVLYAEPDGTQQTITIVGMDEVDPARGFISWISPVARALLKAREGDSVLLRLPQGSRALEILRVAYCALD
jgi:transcription elongation factor GreB